MSHLHRGRNEPSRLGLKIKFKKGAQVILRAVRSWHAQLAALTSTPSGLDTQASFI